MVTLMKTKKDKSTTEENRDRYTISFRRKRVNKLMNEMLNDWKRKNESPSDRIVDILLQEHKHSYSSHARKFKSVFSSVYNALAPVYGEDSEELYMALDEILGEILIINSANLFDLIQAKIDDKTMPHRPKSIPSKVTPPTPTVNPSVREEVPHLQKEKDTSPIQEVELEVATPKTEPLNTILVNGVETELRRVPETPKPVTKPMPVQEESSSEVDFFGSAATDFFSGNSL